MLYFSDIFENNIVTKDGSKVIYLKLNDGAKKYIARDLSKDMKKVSAASKRVKNKLYSQLRTQLARAG